ncbi:S26 family signal peptidase [Tepidiforma flava]|uniref:S26 family signal peptidase n=1 Tax=Tepidiforma flava TaxID=3004094 RepID=A0ABY7M7I6_9CHLR|nr:S26 family signal peptidase [Tepidiforma flava]WBL36481.1 S26 family signal peptidase [Tepidiforma flava]
MRLLAGFLLIAVLAGYLSRRFQRIAVEGDSMRPALRPGDWAIADRRAYRTHPPRPGDVVMARDPAISTGCS